MPTARSIRLLGALLALLALLWVPSGASRPGAAAPPLAPLTTGFADPWVLSAAKPLPRAYADARALGGRMVRLYIPWSQVAPRRPARPASFRDRAYRWALLDRELAQAQAAGMTPLVDVFSAPAWALVPVPGAPDAKAPAPAALAAFATAAATRYSGRVAGVPRVRYWLVWNEPNLDTYLVPQQVGGAPYSPGLYRSLVNAFAAAAKKASPGVVIVGGALTPFAQRTGVGPLPFVRALYCLNDDLTKRCSTHVAIDVWAIHPYTWGGPSKKAEVPGDLSLGDLPELRTTLQAAVRSGNALGKAIPEWTTEFCWASDPPVRGGVPVAVLTRWVAEGLYRMWSNGVTSVLWFQLYDRPPSEGYHCGLYDAPSHGVASAKAAAAAFRFPFVAYSAPVATVWGRTPTSAPGAVTIETLANGKWHVAAHLRADADGMFSARLQLGAWEQARARFEGVTSPPFAEKAPPDPVVRRLF